MTNIYKKRPEVIQSDDTGPILSDGTGRSTTRANTQFRSRDSRNNIHQHAHNKIHSFTRSSKYGPSNKWTANKSLTHISNFPNAIQGPFKIDNVPTCQPQNTNKAISALLVHTISVPITGAPSAPVSSTRAL